MSSPVSMTQMSERPEFIYCRACGACWLEGYSFELHKPGCPLLHPDTGIEVTEAPDPRWRRITRFHPRKVSQ